MTNIDDVLSRLNPKTAKSFMMASDITVEMIETPSLGLNMSIGGFRRGAFTHLYGNRGCGKSLFALETIKRAQRDPSITAAWMDVEKNFTPEWAQRVGVDTDRMLVDNRTMSLAGMADKAIEMIKAGVDILVIDSVSVLLPQSYYEDPKKAQDKQELKGLVGTRQIGSFSKDLGIALDLINSVNERTVVILISQVRTALNNGNASMSFKGGHALEHAPSTTLKLWRRKSEVLEGDVLLSDGLLVKRPVGTRISWTVEKNRGPGMQDINEYNLYTAGDRIGIDLTDEVVTFGVEYGIIKKAAAWLTLPNGERFNGKPSLVEYLWNNPDVEEEVYGEILAKSI